MDFSALWVGSTSTFEYKLVNITSKKKSRFLLDIGFDSHLNQNLDSKFRIIRTMNLLTRNCSRSPLVSIVHKLIWHFPRALASVITTFDHVVKNLDILPSTRLLVNCVTKYLLHFVSQLSDIYFISKLKYSHIHLSSHTHIHFTSGLPRAFPFCLYTWTLTAKKNGVLLFILFCCKLSYLSKMNSKWH